MPRFPNLWFDVASSLASDYPSAVSWVVDKLATTCGLIDDFETSNPEGSDDKARVQDLQPIDDFQDESRNHDHDLHIRYYYGDLTRGKFNRTGDAYRVASSIHYEVAQKHALHPYIDECPACGVTGAYALRGDPCERVHDPLGLELILFGTIRGEGVHGATGQPFTPIQSIAGASIDVAEPSRADINTLRIAHVVFNG